MQAATTRSELEAPTRPEAISEQYPSADLREVRDAWGMACGMANQGATKQEIERELAQSMNLQSAVITVVVAGATAYAGINVMSSIGETMQLTSNDTFYNSSSALETGVEDFFTNLPTVFVVIALVLIIGYLTILR